MSDNHFSSCSTATAHFPYSDSVKEGHQVYFQCGGHMTIIVMNEDGKELTDTGKSNVMDSIRYFLQGTR